MAETPILISGIPSLTWGYNEGQTLYTERLSYTLLQALKIYQDNNIPLKMAIPLSDLEADVSAIDTYVSQLSTWFDSAFAASSEGGRALVPVPPQLPALVAKWAIRQLIQYLIVRVLPNIVSKYIQSKLTNQPADSGADIADILKRAILTDTGESRLAEGMLVDILQAMLASEGIVEIDGLQVWIKSAIADYSA